MERSTDVIGELIVNGIGAQLEKDIDPLFVLLVKHWRKFGFLRFCHKQKTDVSFHHSFCFTKTGWHLAELRIFRSQQFDGTEQNVQSEHD